MVGIDVARIKRWYAMTYPDYSGARFKVVVSVMTQTRIDTGHDLEGEDINFTVNSYNVETNAVAHTVSGTYNRMHYGGWDVHTND